MTSLPRGIELRVGDALDVLPTLDEESVHSVVTSPPYFGLRDYGLPPRAWPAVEYAPMPGLPAITVPEETSALGLERRPEAFIAHLVLVFRELRRVLRPDGTCWVNLGDSYSAAGRGGGGSFAGERRAYREPNSSRSRSVRGLGDKNLVGIPWRFAFAMQADGWTLRNEVIWAKQNPMPSSVRDRLTNAHEQLFLFSRSPRYFFDDVAIREPCADPKRRNRAEGETAFRGQAQLRPRGRSGNTRRVHGDERDRPGSHLGASVPWAGTTRSRRDVWSIASQAYHAAHFATFPEALVEPCILAGTSACGCCSSCGAPWRRAPSSASGISHLRTMTNKQAKVPEIAVSETPGGVARTPLVRRETPRAQCSGTGCSAPRVGRQRSRASAGGAFQKELHHALFRTGMLLRLSDRDPYDRRASRAHPHLADVVAWCIGNRRRRGAWQQQPPRSTERRAGDPRPPPGRPDHHVRLGD